MISFVNYLLESGISLSLFSVVYFLFLRRETFFSINRWFLLVSIGFSALLPLLHIPLYPSQAILLPEVTITPYANLLGIVTVYSTGLLNGTERFVQTYNVIEYVYLLGVIFFSIKLFIQIYQIIRLIASNRIILDGNIKLVNLDRELSPFSFLNYIFVSNNLQNTKGWEKMLDHEKQHIRQGHTFDVLLLELLAVFQWFNPFFWMLRRALRENHEFLADQAVISHGTAPSWYKQILINQYVGEQIVLTNNFHYSLVKNRIQMISKIKSKKIASVKVLVGMILAVSLIAVFACEKKQAEIVPAKTEVYTYVEQMPEFKGGEAELRNFLATNVKYPAEATQKGIQGKVYVSFVVAIDGSVTDAKIARGVNPLLDNEALRVVSSMPKFIPGKQNGKDVATQYTVPINFVLQ
ncbi:MAG TPA: hypothetical protein DCL77_15085 [Prolixibacteraceae bacterium]|jgi:TonB family protein|nr:hypothetical protein [Prolixibacteraceae bacterium]